MKKITLLIMFLSTFWTYSQVGSYSFTQSSGTYTEISGTPLGDATTMSGRRFVDPAIPSGSATVLKGPGFDIGFNFTFNGLVYNRFGVASNGWISLGQSALQTGTAFAVDMSSDSAQSPLDTKGVIGTMPNDLVARISALGGFLQAQTGAALSYATSGTAPNRVLVVQWKNYCKSSVAGDSFNFQIKLYETTNVVSVAYGTFSANATSAKFQVGLRAAPLNTTFSNFVNRTSTTGWNATASGLLSSDVVSMTNILTPLSGLTFSWTPPVCGGPSGFVASAIGDKGAILNWNSNVPAPSEYEYIVTKTAALPLPATSGTATTNLSTAVSNLDPNTVYNVYLRSNCSTEYTPWIFGGTFKTLCSDVLVYSEDFDGYTNGLPDCWSGSDSSTYITNEAIGPITPPNQLFMYGNGSVTTPSAAYAIMPNVSNLDAGTHRLRFNAFSTVADSPLEIGYFTTPGDLNSFVVLQTVSLPDNTVVKTKSFVVTPKALTGVKNLVFRNKGVSTGSATVYIDDVIYEPTPPCADVSAISVKEVAGSSAKLAWTKGGNETEWQYVCVPSTVLNPNSGTAVAYSGTATSVVVTGLMPTSSYRIWVRSKCGTNDFGAWIAGGVFTTTCAAISQFVENFDASASSLPSCWSKISKNGTVSAAALSGAPSAPNVLNLSNFSPGQSAIVSLPPLSNAGAGTQRLRFLARTTVAGSKLEIGYLLEAGDPSTYQYLQTVTINSATTFDSYTVNVGSDPKTSFLVLRNPANSVCSIYLDEVVWEPISVCPDITGLASKSITSTAATIGWTAGSQSGWQYVLGDAKAKDPSLLSAVNTSSPEGAISGLLPLTTYKVWVRSKCSDTSLGSWFGPVVFSTSCASDISFSQNFDASTAMPACWNKVSSVGSISISTSAVKSAPNALYLSAAASVGQAVVSMPPVSNAGAGTYRLKFKAKAAAANSVLEVGYLINFADPTSFSPLYTYTASQNTSFESKYVELGTEPTTDYLAFRVPLTADAFAFYIDDVVWEKIPVCTDISNVIVTSTNNSTANIAWTAGSEKAWQYVIGDATVTNPDALVAVNVTTNPVAAITGLTPTSSYKVWVRSSCGSGKLGYWSDPVTFKTTCDPVSGFAENFDSSTSLPSCWTKVDGTGTVSILNSTAVPSSPSLYMYTQSPSQSLVVSLRPVSNAGAGTHRLKFKCFSNTIGAKFDVGYLINPNDASTFQLLSTVTVNAAENVTTTYQTVRIDDIGGQPAANQVLAFRMPALAGGVKIYIDDVVWEPLPFPADVSQINSTSPTSNSTTIVWSSAGTETQWQVSVRPASETAPDDPTALIANVTKSLVMSGLSPSSTYKVWVRSVNGAANGDWIGPVVFNTQCINATALNENFNAAPGYPELPVCWSKIVRNAAAGASVSVSATTDAVAKPFNVVLNGNTNSTPNADIILVSPRMSNLSSGTLKFTALGSANVEVGTLNNSDADLAVFSKIQEITLSSAYTNAIVNFSSSTTDQYIGIRLKTDKVTQNAIIDNLTWDANAPVLANDQFDLSQFNYYPNPVKDVLNISYVSNISGVTVYNLLGQEVVTKTVNENFSKVDMSSLTRGTYMVKVTSDNQVKTIKVIKE